MNMKIAYYYPMTMGYPTDGPALTCRISMTNYPMATGYPTWDLLRPSLGPDSRLSR